MRGEGSTADALDLDACLVVAVRAAEEAGQRALRHFRGAYGVRDKSSGGPGRFDPVTRADEEVEDHLRRVITQSFPRHAIMGEEAGGSLDAPVVWVLDPIDGTKSFLAGSPLWGVLVGLVVDGEPVLGVMHQPVLGETFVGTGDMAWVRTSAGQRPLATSATARLEDAIVGCGDPRVFQGEDDVAAGFAELMGRSRLVRYGGDCYGYCLVAMGHMDAIVERGLQPYDVLPLVPIVTGAGGVIAGLDGSLVNGGTVVASATPGLYAEIQQALTTQASAVPDPVG